jgi:hypothetical protein
MNRQKGLLLVDEPAWRGLNLSSTVCKLSIGSNWQLLFFSPLIAYQLVFRITPQ